ncbi:unnamed protein product [Soboliphyme baturini]|uniref:Major sperm protein n=1 Tax=Soboliphyme baturini TaxID=241478 RepID=A0A183J0J9_9BILA|nr:unnamed protein product [Soboliphyme baturini]
MTEKELDQTGDSEDEYALNLVNISTESIMFEEPFSKQKIEKIRLINPSEKTIGFKIKTTRPSYLTTNPAFGVLESHRALYVQAKFRALTDGAKPPKKDRLSFLFAVVPKNLKLNKPSELWKRTDEFPKIIRRITVEISYSQPESGMGEIIEEGPVGEVEAPAAEALPESEKEEVEEVAEQEVEMEEEKEETDKENQVEEEELKHAEEKDEDEQDEAENSDKDEK